jgi:hypothetical protein
MEMANTISSKEQDAVNKVLKRESISTRPQIQIDSDLLYGS